MDTHEESNIRQAALRYHANGYAVLDVPHKTKIPPQKGWQNLRYTAEQVKAKFNGKPQNVGIILGEASGGLVDVDLDCEEAIRLAPEHLPATPAKFGRAGSPQSHWGYVVNLPCDTTQHRDAAGRMIVELRSTGGQTIFPPSVHPSGEPIRWEPDAGEPAHVDADELRAAVKRLAEAVKRERGEIPSGGSSRATSTSAAGEQLLTAAKRYAAKVPPAAEGGRNKAAFSLAGHLAAFETDTGERLTEADILDLLRQWNQGCTPPLPPHEVETAVHSALNNGTPREPHVVQTGADGYDGPLGWDGTPAGESNPQARQNIPTKKLRMDARTDTGLAERFASQHAGRARYCYQWGKWLAYDGRRWDIDATGQVEAWAKATARSILKEAANEPDDDERKALVQFARSAESASRRAAMIRLAQSEEGIPISPEKLDVDPWLLNVQNGTLDLRTGTLRKHSPTDLITKLSPVAHHADAQAPTWLDFRAGIFGGSSTIDHFVQRLAGYCLTGIVRDQILPIFWGTGANGKSTLVNALLEILGDDYGMKAPAELLMAGRGDQHPTERADLHGKRLVAAIETGEGRRLAEALVKELTGGDRIRARRMREDFWEFLPTHKVILATNHKPEIRGTDHAIWRRVRLVPFTVCIPDSEQDKALPEKLKAELPGILAWAVQGCLDWQRHGLGEPEDIRTATNAYRTSQDALGRFIAECCLEAPECRVKASELLDAYRTWAGDHRMTQRRFGVAISERGFTRRTSNGVWYDGIGLASHHDGGV